jgi:hypothetical protein
LAGSGIWRGTASSFGSLRRRSEGFLIRRNGKFYFGGMRSF